MTFPHLPVLPVSLPDGVVTLSGAQSAWGIIRVAGEDATRFLHAQFTNDFALLKPDQARLAAFCNAKGRMQASFVAVRTQLDAAGAEYLLVCRKDLLPAVLKRLRMFVLRSKVTLEDATNAWALYGLLGESALAAWGEDAAEAAPWSHRVQAGRHLVWLYPAAEQDGRVARALCLQANSAAVPAGNGLDVSVWELSEVLAGVASIGTATWEAFVPQMVNYESVGGVNFKKGCYPGQEVVARSQFRGAIKRRAQVLVASVDAAAPVPEAGQDVWRVPPDGTEAEPCGTIAQVATTDGGVALLASLQNAATEAAANGHAMLRAGSAEGIELTLLPLPYPLLEDI